MMTMLIRLLFLVTLAALLGATDAVALGIGGSVVSYNADNKTVVILSNEKKITVRYDDKTWFESTVVSKSELITNGCLVKVNGKISDDEKAIAAFSIERLNSGWRAFNKRDSFCVGVFQKTNDTITVALNDKTIAIGTTKQTAYHARVASGAHDLTKGRYIWVTVSDTEEQGARLAQSVIIRAVSSAAPAPPPPQKTSPSTPAENKPTPPAGKPATPQKQASGPVNGTVMDIDMQNLALKLARNGDTKQPVAYNITLLTEVIVNGKPAKMEDIKKGMNVTVASDDGKDASRIEAAGSLPPIQPTPKKPAKK
jgi:hypothetical protein